MKVCLNGKLVPTDNLMKVACIRYGIGKFNLFERSVFKAECGKYLQVNTFGGSWWNHIVKIKEVDPKMICDLLEGQDIDKETEEVLLKEHLVEVVECPTKS
jgi:hypothetical protein